MRKMAVWILALGFTTLAWGSEITLKIEGMSCPQGCVKRVETALSKVKGVTDKKVAKAVAWFRCAQRPHKWHNIGG